MTEDTANTSSEPAAQSALSESSPFDSAKAGFADPKAFATQLDNIANGIDPADATPEEPVKEDNADNNTDQDSDNDAAHDDDLDDDDAMPDRGAVPKSRFKKAVDKKNEYKQQAQSAHDEKILIQQKYDALQEALSKTFGEVKNDAPSQENLDPIDPETTNMLLKEIKALKDQMAQSEEKTNVVAAQTSFRDTLQAHQDAFVKSNPDFLPAYQHLLETTYAEKLELGLDNQTAHRETMVEMQQAAALAVKNNKNAAEVLYKRAKARGYAAKLVDQRKTGPDFDKIEKNMRKSSSINELPSANNGTLTGGYTPEMISQLAKRPGGFVDPKNFEKLLANVKNSN